jgi:hypothetical protein
MTEQLEQRLRDILADDAQHAPADRDLRAGAMRQVRRHRRVRLVATTGCIAAITSVAVLASVLFGSGDRAVQPTARSTGSPAVSTPRGALPVGIEASCASEYSTKTLAGQAFAFDGTVTAIGAPQTNRDGGGVLPLVSASFAVHEWFRGGSGQTVTVDIAQPRSTEDGPPSYAVGTRLLVSGQPRWGGAPLDDPIAWGCGFTRYYDSATAATWQTAFG